ncbi:MAG: 50S ribosomal protein L21 [candidate division Zixibacteria bacterium SM23_73_3]|nr:MAG: 50S ribosomal protein L21 [candidate division Zixibacteria bacterium SM23_73_3]
MYAILETGGFQFSVKEGEKIKIPKLQVQPKEKVTLNKVLFIGGEKTLIGTPYIKNAKVKAEVLGSGKGEKVTVFKFKRRVKYRRRKGHRQEYTEIEIEKILRPK